MKPNKDFSLGASLSLPDAWNVEQIQDDGSVSVVVFSGADAQKLAQEYCDWKNGLGSAKLFVIRRAVTAQKKHDA